MIIITKFAPKEGDYDAKRMRNNVHLVKRLLKRFGLRGTGWLTSNWVTSRTYRVKWRLDIGEPFISRWDRLVTLLT